MSARHDYTEQAARYDRTRRASPSIVRPLVAALDGSPGTQLLDVGGGTGNYAAAVREAGFAPTVVDVSSAMLREAAGKDLRVVRADAAALPVADEAVDAVTMVSMLHLVEDWRRALAEARRVLRPLGRLALAVYAREHLDVTWVFSYFPKMRRRLAADHQSIAEIVAELPGAEVRPFAFTDLEDASVAALCREPHLLLDPAYRNQTSFFERLERNDPEELAHGIERLRRDLEAGRAPHDVAALRDRMGDGAVVGWER